MLLRLYCSSQHMPRKCKANKGFPLVMYLLWLLKQRGITIEIVDTATLSDEDVEVAYNEAVVPSVTRKHKIREVLGTKRRSAIRFGKGVPALLVYEDVSQPPIDVFPHKVRQGDSVPRWEVTIFEYLTYLKGQRTSRPQLIYVNRPLTLAERRSLRMGNC